MSSQHGADFNENFSEVITIDAEIIGATGQEGYLAGMDTNFVNTDNSMTVDTSDSIANDGANPCWEWILLLKNITNFNAVIHSYLSNILSIVRF